MNSTREHDYIVVGAGSAGCVLAQRLAEEEAATVLLLEAGALDLAPEIHIPIRFPDLFGTAHDWAYFTEAQPRLDARRLYWPRGKVAGGSSSINAMVYIRGNRYDYDNWEELGNPGWGFADVLPYFKKAERYADGDPDLHGVSGPLHVSPLRTVNPVSRAFVEAAEEIGLARNRDFNGPDQEGVGFYRVTQRRGLRDSAATAYLAPARRRPNVITRFRARATRVLFEGRRAVGVEHLERGARRQARAAREVILCGGAVNSPHLLLLSGVGPAHELRALGLPVIADLPGVGQNLQDHLVVGVIHECTRPVTLENAGTLWNLLKLLLFRRGPLTSNIDEAGGFVRTRPGLPAPDLQLHCAPAYYADHGQTRPPGHWFTLGASLLRPASRGSIGLRSADPLDPPLIEPRYLEDETDLDLLLEGVRLVRRIAAARALSTLRGREASPGPEVQRDEDLRAFVRAGAQTIYHPVGTCKMGSDPLAVVNARLEVHGLMGLRVVDASVMPAIPSGNTNAPTIMIAEKAADMIKAAAGT